MSQFYIVFCHTFLLFIAKESDEQIYKAIQMPLHIGVIVFVLLSGYFSIKPSSKKLIKLLSIFVVYTMPETIYTLTHSDNTMKTVHSLFILSYTHFWFIKTYLFLFLVSPMLNFYWDNSSKAQRIYMTAALGFVAVYMATTHGDKSMLSGKNLVNFMFLYYVGRLIWQYKEKWQKNRIYATGRYLCRAECRISPHLPVWRDDGRQGCLGIELPLQQSRLTAQLIVGVLHNRQDALPFKDCQLPGSVFPCYISDSWL